MESPDNQQAAQEFEGQSAAQDAQDELRQRNRKLGLRLTTISICMLILVPAMYWGGGLVCDWAGIGLNPDSDDMEGMGTDAGGRKIRVYCNAEIARDLQGLVSFTVDTPRQDPKVAEFETNYYEVKNTSKQTLYIRPTHYVADKYAQRAFMMVECFCYNDMELAPGESRRLKVVYGFKPELDERVGLANVSYTLNPITRSEMRAAQEMPNKGPFRRLEDQHRGLQETTADSDSDVSEQPVAPKEAQQ